MSALQFNEATHTYTLDGRRLPSVTEILADVGIVDYSKIAPDVRERALARGRIVHMCTQFDDELSLTGSKLADSEIDPEVAGYVEAWRRFRRETGFTPELIEHRGCNLAHAGLAPNMFSGTLDRTGRFNATSPVDLLDIKTGKAMPWTRFQTAAYASFFDKPRLLRRYCVELHDDGTYKSPFVFDGREWLQDFNVFISAMNVYLAKHPEGAAKRRAA